MVWESSNNDYGRTEEGGLERGAARHRRVQFRGTAPSFEHSGRKEMATHGAPKNSGKAWPRAGPIHCWTRGKRQTSFIFIAHLFSSPPISHFHLLPASSQNLAGLQLYSSILCPASSLVRPACPRHAGCTSSTSMQHPLKMV